MRMPSPAAWAKIHGSLSVAWVILAVPSVLWWRESIPYLVFISVYANFAGSIASWTAAKADCNSPTVEQLDRLERKVDALQARLATLKR